MSFDIPSRLEEHERIHSGETPYACLQCPRKFKLSSNMFRHLRSHAEKNVTVGASSEKLKTHAEAKAYKCDNFLVLEDELEEEEKEEKEDSNVTISTNSTESVFKNTNPATFQAENLSEQDRKTEMRRNGLF